jgi:hypothetical protein
MDLPEPSVRRGLIVSCLSGSVLPAFMPHGILSTTLHIFDRYSGTAAMDRKGWKRLRLYLPPVLMLSAGLILMLWPSLGIEVNRVAAGAFIMGVGAIALYFAARD